MLSPRLVTNAPSLLCVLVVTNAIAGCQAGAPRETEPAGRRPGPVEIPQPPELPIQLDDLGPSIVRSADDVGVLPGTSAVVQGELRYQLPIEVPDGRAGMAPTLALEYHDGGGNGLLGIGWSLSGASEIQACARTIAIDGRIEGVDYDDSDGRDALCLDGARLVEIGMQGESREYRTERDQFLRILQHVSGGASSWFEIYHPDGEIATYLPRTGQRMRVEAHPPDDTITLVPDGTVTVAWVRTRLRDRSGNTISYEYEEPSSPDLAVGYRLRSIKYTGRCKDGAPSCLADGEAPRREVRFEYQDRPDPRSSYQAGVRWDQAVRLHRLRMFAPSPAPGAPDNIAELWHYDLSYEVSPSTGRSRLSGVERCGALGSCLRMKQFAYSGDAQVSFDTSLTVGGTGYEFPLLSLDNVLRVFDANGDGRDDVLYHESSTPQAPGVDNLYIRLGSTTGLGPRIQLNAGEIRVISSLADSLPIDVDNDGTTELIAPTLLCTGPAAPWPSCGGGSMSDDEYRIYRLDLAAQKLVEVGDPFPSQYFGGGGPLEDFPGLETGWDTMIALDADGDGRTDLLQESLSHRWVVRKNLGGGAFAAPIDTGMHTSASGRSAALDLDGDGRADLLAGSQTVEARAIGLDNGGNVTVQPRDDLFFVWARMRYADINGDGLADALPRADNGAGVTMARWNTGRGFTPLGDLLNGPVSTDPESSGDTGVRVTELNGDGIADFLVFHHSSDEIRAHVSRGVGTYVIQVLPYEAGAYLSVTSQGWLLSTLGDFDGDGRTDILHVVDGRLQIRRNTTPDGDRLVEVSDESAPQPALRIRRDRVRAAKGVCAYPQRCIDRGQSLVTMLEVNQGADLAYFTRTYYQYRDARYDVVAQESLGFGEIRTWEPDRPRETVTRFDHHVKIGNHYPFAGHPAEVEVRTPIVDEYSWDLIPMPPPTSATVRVSRSDYTYVRHDLNGGKTFFVHPDQWITEELERGGAIDWTPEAWNHVALSGAVDSIQSRTHTSRYDDYGNLTDRSSIPFDSGLRRTETTTFDNRTIPWLIRLPTQRQLVEWNSGSPPPPRTQSWEYDTLGRMDRAHIENGNADPSIPLHHTYQLTADGLPEAIVSTDDTGEVRTQFVDWGYVAGEERVYPRVRWRIVDGIDHAEFTLFHPGTGDLVAFADSNEVTTTRSYDELHRMVDEHPQGGQPTQIERVPRLAGAWITGIVSTVTHPGGGGNGGYTRTTTDELGRAIERRVQGHNLDFHVEKTVYDVLGRVAYRKELGPEPGGAPGPSYLYDSLDRIELVSRADGTSVTYAYGTHWIQRIDEEAHEKLLTFDHDGRLFKSIVPHPNGSKTLRYEYTTFDQLRRVVDESAGNQPLESRSYDRRGRQIHRQDANIGPIWITSYNAFGDITSEGDAVGTTTYQLDGLGRRKTTTSPDGVTTFTWDTAAANGIGKLASSESSDGVVKAYTYDLHGRLASETLEVEGDAFVTSYTHDGVGRRRQMRYPEIPGHPQLVVLNAYDTVSDVWAVGKLSDPDDDETAQWLWTVDQRKPNKQLIKATFGEGAFHASFTYDPVMQRLKSLEISGAAKFEYGHDGDGRVTSRHETKEGRSERFEYGAYGRLDRWTVQSREHDYGYDLLGNLRLVQVDGVTEDAILFDDLAHPFLSTGFKRGGVLVDSFEHDARGRTRKQTGAEERVYKYTEFDLPRSITRNGEVTSFAYDAAHVRAVKKTPDETVVYVGEHLERHTPKEGEVWYLARIYGPEGEIAQLTYDSNASTLKYNQADLLGSATVVLDKAGTVLERLTFEPFGARVDHDGDPITLGAWAPGFTGHRQEDNLGLIDMRGRWYDPQRRRFLTTDPVQRDAKHPHAYNPYAYVLNDPIQLRDPSGFDPIPPATCCPAGDPADHIIGSAPVPAIAPSLASTPGPSVKPDSPGSSSKDTATTGTPGTAAVVMLGSSIPAIAEVIVRITTRTQPPPPETPPLPPAPPTGQDSVDEPTTWSYVTIDDNTVQMVEVQRPPPPGPTALLTINRRGGRLFFWDFLRAVGIVNDDPIAVERPDTNDPSTWDELPVPAGAGGPSGRKLSPSQKRQVQEAKDRDLADWIKRTDHSQQPGKRLPGKHPHRTRKKMQDIIDGGESD